MVQAVARGACVAVVLAQSLAAADEPEPGPTPPPVQEPVQVPAVNRYFSLGMTRGDSIGETAGSAICRLLMRLSGETLLPRAENPRCSMVPASGAAEVVNQLAGGRIAFAIVPAAVAVTAHDAANPHDGGAPTDAPRSPDVRAVLSLGAEPLNLVVARDSGIATVADLRGRRMNIGPPQSLGSDLIRALLAFHRISPGDLRQADEMAPGRAAPALCAGDLDAYGLVVGGPAVTVARATDECGARLIPLSRAAVAAIVAEIPGTVPTAIPKGTYATTAEAVPSVGVVSLLVTSADASEVDVYGLTQTIVEHINEIRGFHPALADLTPERMAREGILLPLHPGALRYFRERGWRAGG
ncbi:MAG: TAXI family TRAP transporter solute-binding subunit [Rhodospirillales bacterium]